MRDQIAQDLFTRQRRRLQKLAQLVHLNLPVDLLEPLFRVRLKFRVSRFRIVPGHQRLRGQRAGRYLNDKFRDQRPIDGLQGLKYRELVLASRVQTTKAPANVVCQS